MQFPLCMVYPITRQGCKVNEHEDPVFEFQQDCINEVLDEHKISSVVFCHDLIALFFKVAAFMSDIKECGTGESLFRSFASLLENYDEGSPSLRCLEVLAEIKIKVLELENQIAILKGEENG
jgi:hypothetical protein